MFLAQLDLAPPIGDAKRLVPRRVRRGRPTGQRPLCSQPSTEPHVSSDPRHTPDAMSLATAIDPSSDTISMIIANLDSPDRPNSCHDNVLVSRRSATLPRSLVHRAHRFRRPTRPTTARPLNKYAYCVMFWFKYTTFDATASTNDIVCSLIQIAKLVYLILPAKESQAKRSAC